jgi:hypothetical protein
MATTNMNLPEPAADALAASEPQPVEQLADGWPADEFTGVGGNYVRDAVTGRRTRAEPVAE